MHRIAVALFATSLLASPLSAQPLADRPQWRASFDSAGVRGTFVLKRLGVPNATLEAYDTVRARRRFLPASTFKIPNAIIALDLGIVKDERQWFPMTWPRQEIPAWNRGHTFATSMKYSVVPIYQAIARQVGEARYRERLARFAYGNQNPGGGVDRFWLEGDLAISAVEQIAFLERLAALSLPATERSQRIVRDMIVREANDCYLVRAKTGLIGVSATRTLDPVGWYVGLVETDTATWAFALNIDGAAPNAMSARVPLAKSVLARAGVIPKRCGA